MTQLSCRQEVVDVLRAMERLPYLGEPISQLAHSLQSGFQLKSQGSDEELVLAGVLHDVGRAPDVTRSGESHEVTGSRWVTDRFGDRIGWLVRQHVPAKRILVTVDDEYLASLSTTSVATLRIQGGPAAEEEVNAFMEHSWANDALALRRADDSAKSIDGLALDLDEVGELVERFERASAR